MPASPVNRIEASRQTNDCAAWALHVYLGLPYVLVWQTVVKIDRSKSKRGLFPRTIQRVSRALGHPLHYVRRPKVNDDTYAILLVEDREAGHAVVVRNGLVFDTDATVWELDAWLAESKFTVTGLLEADA